MAEQAGQKSGVLGWYFDANLLVRITIGLLAGAALGIFMAYAAPDMGAKFEANTRFLGAIFIRLLNMIIVPTIFFSLITGASSISPANLGRVGAKTLLFYLVLVLVAIAIGLILGNVFRPGDGLNIVGNADVKVALREAPPLSEVLLAIIPLNPIDALAKAQVLPIIFFALCFGIGLAYLRDSKDATMAKGGETLFTLCSAAAETMYKIVNGIMQYAPIGVFFLIAGVLAIQGPKVIGPLVFIMALAYVGFILHVVLGFGGVLTLFGLSFVKFMRGAQEASLTAFVTRSSNATLPISLRVCEENLGVPRSISSFSLPIGATINMDGTAIYLALGAMFIGFSIGQPLTMDQQFVVAITATLGAIGAAGVPGAGAIMMLLVLESIGLKVEAGTAIAASYAMLLGVDTVFDMGRTCLNVTGDIVAATVVSKHEGVLDMSKW